MRDEENPFSKQIKDFDQRIKADLQKKEELRLIWLTLKEKDILVHSEMAGDNKEVLRKKNKLLQEIEQLKTRQRFLQHVPELNGEDVKE